MKDGSLHTNASTVHHLDVKCTQGDVELSMKLSPEAFMRLFGQAVATKVAALEEENARLREQHLKDTERALDSADTVNAMQREKQLLQARVEELEQTLARAGAASPAPAEPPFVHAINPDLFPGAPQRWACRLWDALLSIAEHTGPQGRPLVANGSHIAAVYLSLCSLRRLRYPFSANKEWFVSGWNANVASRVADPHRAAALRIACGTLRSAVSRSPLRDAQPALWRRQSMEGDAASQRAFAAGAEILTVMKEAIGISD